MASVYSGHLLSSLLCHWLVGKAGRHGSLDVVPLAGALKWAVLLTELEKDGAKECLAVVVKLLLSGSVCGLVCRHRKESCEVKRRAE